MKQLIRLTETDLHNIIKKVINEVVDESGFLQGAHKATLDNLRKKIDMGYLHTIRPNGTKIPNDKRVEPLNTHNEDMNNDFFKEYNEENIVIPFSVYLNNSYIYGFDYTLKRIENIDMSYMSIVGDMDITKTIGNPPSFMRTYSPKIKSDVILKFDFDKNVLKYTRNPKGLVIRPALNVDGANNEWWNRLVLYASDYKKGIQRYGRQ